MIKILIVDDSLLMRTAISTSLKNSSDIHIAGTLNNGKQAVEYLSQNPDINLITMDLEMPVMDGITAIKEIRKFNKNVKIIIFSAHSQKGAEKTFEAINAGASDFVAKLENATQSIDQNLKNINDELVPKIRALCSKTQESVIIPEKIEPFNYIKFNPDLICIGCSTGGPDALGKIFKNVKLVPTVPIVVVQHMPPLFTKQLANILSKDSSVKFREATHNERLESGIGYIAPGDFHLQIGGTKQNLQTSLNQEAKVCSVRPSVDVTLNSLFELNLNILTIILTGMGEDGLNGCKKLATKKFPIFIQDEKSCIVWGMPGAIYKANIGAKTIELGQISKLIETYGCKI